jgi:hypothetical protein
MAYPNFPDPDKRPMAGRHNCATARKRYVARRSFDRHGTIASTKKLYLGTCTFEVE